MINDFVFDKLNLQGNDLLLVFDPDNLLAAEDIVGRINRSGFTIIDYEDPEVFRYFYEENIRSILDQGEEPSNLKIIIRYTTNQTIPYDIQLKCSFVELSLRDIFPKLSYNVIKELYTEVFDRLYSAYQNYNGPRLGDKGTKDFILRYVYGIIPEAITNFHDLIKTFISFYYKGEELPKLLADYAVEMLCKNNYLEQFSISVVVSKGAFFHFLQEQWEQYVKYVAGEDVAPMVEFSRYEIRAYMDNLFQENFLSPVKKQFKPRECPSWMQAGIVYDIAGNAKRSFERGIAKIHTILQGKISYKDWFAIAGIWGKILVLKHDHEKNYSLDDKKYIATRSLLNQKFKTWLFDNYGMLSSLSYAKVPVMVHKIPWHINYRLRKDGSNKAALIVMDGMSLDNWYVMKDLLNDRYIYEESLCFAWIPTITPVSRQAIFSGEIPANFSDTILSTNYDAKQWKKFWNNIGFADESIAYQRNIKEFNEEGLKDIVEDERIKILGVVVNIIDDIMHGQQLSVDGMHHDIRLWITKGYLQRFLESLFSKGFEVFITSDHGNVGAVGQGGFQEGLAVESAGERVRIYSSDISCDEILSKLKAFKWSGVGLPSKYSYILCEKNYAFIKEGKKIVSHGGSAIEEVIVPFIHIRKRDSDA